MKTKIRLGESVKGKVESVYDSVYDSVSSSAYDSVGSSVYSSINNSTRWRIRI